MNSKWRYPCLVMGIALFVYGFGFYPEGETSIFVRLLFGGAFLAAPAVLICAVGFTIAEGGALVIWSLCMAALIAVVYGIIYLLSLSF